jgi:hypothetical protein
MNRLFKSQSSFEMTISLPRRKIYKITVDNIYHKYYYQPMMRNISIGILDKDPHYVKAFMSVVALEHKGFVVGARGVCKRDCPKDVDVCIRFEPYEESAHEACEKAFWPVCGRYAGVSAILSEARAFVIDRRASASGAGRSQPFRTSVEVFPDRALLCVYACAGGLGTSAAAIGIGRELARYRGEQALYLSLEDAEDPGLFPAGLQAMRAEEVLYRYLRILNNMGADGVHNERIAFEELFSAAAARDEYGLRRLAPDDGLCCLAGLAAGELYMFLRHFAAALGLTRLVLDFGTRLYSLASFASMLEEEEAFFIEALPVDEDGVRKRKKIVENEATSISAVFPCCPEDVRIVGNGTDIGLANAFGLAVKEVCDRIMGDAL